MQDMNVLIVDDEDKICDLIRLFLESSFRFKSIVTAPSVMHATQKLVNQEFDLLILDNVMPGKQGVEFIQQLKQSLKFGRMKIILISGYLEQEEALKAIHNGVKHIVVKPFTKQLLIEKVRDILRLEGDEEKAG
jgi:YesN/AraC family two-component response regulator